MAEQFRPVGRYLRFAMGVVGLVALSLAGATPAPAQSTGVVTKTASPGSQPEPGGEFTFTVTITNSTGGSARILALIDSVHGDLTSRPTCNTAVGTVLSSGAVYSCTFNERFEGNADAEQASSTTVRLEITSPGPGAGGGGSVVSRSFVGGTIVAITNVEPTVTVTHSVAPASRPAPGGNFTYTTVVTNTSQEPVTISSLVDDIYGNLASRGTCTTAVGTTLAPGASYTCSFTDAFNAAAGTSLIDQVTVTVTDDDRSSASASATATITITSTITSTIAGTTTSLTTTASTTTASTTTTSSITSSTTSTTSPTTVPTTQGTTTTLRGLDLLSGPSSEPGGEVRVRGAGCTANGRVVVLIGTTRVGEAQAGPDGTFEATVAAPDAQPGRVELVADCGVRLSTTLDLVVSSQVDPLSSTLAVFIFFVLLCLVLFRRRRVILPRRQEPPVDDL